MKHPQPLTILVCGSRDWPYRPTIARILGLFAASEPSVIHGGASGADAIAGDVATALGYLVTVYRAEWATHGRAAGPLRNQRMIDEGKPDVVIAFRVSGESRGTDDMVRRARAAGIPTWLVNEEDV